MRSAVAKADDRSRETRDARQRVRPGQASLEQFEVEIDELADRGDEDTQGDRRSQSSGRRVERSTENASTLIPDDTAFCIPFDWNRMALFILVAVILAVPTTMAAPPVPTLVAGSIAGVMVVFSGKLAALERRVAPRPIFRFALMAFTIPIPVALMSFAISYWMQTGGLDAIVGVAQLVCLNAVALALLGPRLVPRFCAQVACWGTFAVVDGSLEALGVVSVAIVVFGAVNKYQAGIQRVEAERSQARERIRNRAEDILRDYEDTGQGWFWETDRRGQIAYVSDSVARALGKPAEDLVGRPFTELFELDHDNREGERTLNFHLSARSAFTELAVRAGTVEERWWSVNGRPIFDSFRNFCGFRGSGTDLTEKKKNAEHVTRLARFDSLTGLANRFQMAQSLEKILSAPLDMHRECSVFLLDLDRFKHVNDTMGHPAGDALLKQVAQRLERTVGKMGRVGRLGGDEFEVIVPGRYERNALAALAREIIANLSQPYSIEGQRVVIGASIGVAVSPHDGTSSEALIRNADLALYAAKDGGRGRFHFYAADLHSAAEERSRLEEDLRDAVTQGNLELYYQPVIHTSTEKISGFEALLRWNHPEQGWLSPAKFIPIAEESGIIHAIGEWVIRTACQDLAGWPAEVRCAVNVSPLQFANNNLPTIVANAIAHAGIDPSRLELEITESVFLNDDEGTDAMFAALKGIGVRLALDDFGTGYSSLGYLKKAPFDKIKIDQSFVRGATIAGSRNGAIIASITSLAQALNMDTTAEGVETLDELDLVRMYGCSHVQGYIYEKALSQEDATNRLKTGLEAIAQGPRQARSPRSKVLRKVVIENSGHHYNGTVRNISISGAMVEGLWNVPPGTIFKIALSDTLIVTATSRWSTENRMGVEFSKPLRQDNSGRFIDL
ncbi:EAL domain-containing protein [Tsuneonella mangrovi]|uniref:EAL domain-containing protein n=1 Tax=Tsuneonella mangrovi TaxID=1982042 RepID=UPI001F0AD126|nr:EAL domain-containing protein [Tsuneonella mangrovi]